MRFDGRESSEQKELREIGRDAQMQQLLSAGPGQVGAWVDSTATSLAGVRVVLKLILRALIVLARRELK